MLLLHLGDTWLHMPHMTPKCMAIGNVKLVMSSWYYIYSETYVLRPDETTCHTRPL